MDNTAIIKTLKDSLANILLALLKTPNKLNKKIISLLKTINKGIDVSISKVKLCLRLVSGFDKKCKGAQIRIRKLKKIWKKEETKKSWEEFRLA